MTALHVERTPEHPHFTLLTDIYQRALQDESNAVAPSFSEMEKVDDASLTELRDQTIEAHLQTSKLFAVLPEPVQMKLKAALAAVWDKAFRIGYLFAVERTDQ